MKEETFWKKFWDRVDDSAGPTKCWIWKGSKKEGGYGYVWKARGDRSKRKVLAHRLGYEWHYGEGSANGFLVMHKCDNPPCVNWRHLVKGTKADNSKDMWKKGRGAIGEKSGQAKLTVTQVKTIHRLLRSGIWVADIARHFGIGYETVNRIAKGKQWRSVGVVKIKERKRGRGLFCLMVEGEPPKQCLRKAAVKVVGEKEVRYFCSSHGLPIVLSGEGKAEAA